MSLVPDVRVEAEESPADLDGTLSLCAGRVSNNTSFIGEDAPEELQQTSSSVRLAIDFSMFVLCAVMGSVVPLASDFTKTYPSTYVSEDNEVLECVNHGPVDACKKGFLLYQPLSQVFVTHVLTCVAFVLVTAVLSGRKGLAMCVRPRRLKTASGIGFLDAVGDSLQLIAIGASDAAFYMVISQLKLIATAVVAKSILKKEQTLVQWLTLIAITVCCLLYCDLDLQLVQFKGRGDMEVFGLTLALAKVAQSAVASVLTERAFKKAEDEPIWVNQVQLKLCSIPVALLFVVLKGMIYCEPSQCLQTTGFFYGWDYRTVALCILGVVNFLVLGVIYKNAGAVIKYLAYAQSLWITYVMKIVVDGWPFCLDLFLVVIILVILVIAYSMAKAQPQPAKIERLPLTKSDKLPLTMQDYKSVSRV